MRKILLAILLLGISLVSLSADTYKGTFVLKDGKVIVAPQFMVNDNKTFHALLLDYNNQSTDIKIANIKKIIITKPGKTEAVVFLKDGKQFKIHFYIENIFSTEAVFMFYKALDPISGKLKEQTIIISKIKEIIFDEDYGELRIDNAKNVFPPDYVYSPYTGEKMKLIKTVDLPNLK